MESVNVRNLKHDTSRLIERVELGETVEIRRRNHPVAVLGPAVGKKRKKRPDFRSRLKDIYGETMLERTGTEVISTERGER